MRNFNQIIQSNTELLETKLGTRLTDEKSRDFLRAILRAIDGSTRLINNARTLGRIRANRNPVLSTVDLSRSLERAVQLVKRSNPGRTLVVRSQLPRAVVVADELLDEVFVNILYNSVRYTDSKRVAVEISLKRTEDIDHPNASRRPYWKVTITDRGKGIPDEMKTQVSTRYQQTGTVGGLGLSIVHALVVERYQGKLEIGNRLKSDYTKGTKVEIWLPKVT